MIKLLSCEEDQCHPVIGRSATGSGSALAIYITFNSSTLGKNQSLNPPLAVDAFVLNSKT